MTPTIRTLIADDSETFRTLLREVLSAEPGFTVVAEARDGTEAVALASSHQPDLVVMDIRMPVMDGFEATRRIMRDAPTRVVIVTALGTDEVRASFDAVATGALTLLAKPPGPVSSEWESERARFVRTLRRMAEVKVVRRWLPEPPRASPVPPALPRADETRARLVGIAASTGGPGALRTVLAMLPRDFPAPILIVQHMTDGFLEGFAQWLDGGSPLSIRVAAHGAALAAGNVYLAPTDRHLGIGTDGRIALSDEPPIGGFRPSGTHLFRSLAAAAGGASLGIVLTGMGRDGADGLSDLRRAGGRVIAQDAASSVVYGMPAAAHEAGVCDAVLPLTDIAGAMVQYCAA